MKTRNVTLLALPLAAAVGLFTLANAAEVKAPLSGIAAAQTVCSRCHEIGAAQVPGRHIGDGTPPPFAMIAQDPKMTPEALRRYIRFPHGAMDNVFLTQRETDALVAYIQSLKSSDKGAAQP